MTTRPSAGTGTSQTAKRDEVAAGRHGGNVTDTERRYPPELVRAIEDATEFACEGERDVFSPDYAARFIGRLHELGWSIEAFDA
jgi:hypothetical protein